MNVSRPIGSVCALVTVWLAAASVADESPQALRHNPFSRPALEEPTGVSRPGAAATMDVADVPLRGTLSAGSESLANVGGELLAVGDRYQGWTVAAIGEGEVQFVSGQQRITVPVAGTDKEEQDVRKPRR